MPDRDLYRACARLLVPWSEPMAAVFEGGQDFRDTIDHAVRAGREQIRAWVAASLGEAEAEPVGTMTGEEIWEHGGYLAALRAVLAEADACTCPRIDRTGRGRSSRLGERDDALLTDSDNPPEQG